MQARGLIDPPKAKSDKKRKKAKQPTGGTRKAAAKVEQALASTESETQRLQRKTQLLELLKDCPPADIFDEDSMSE